MTDKTANKDVAVLKAYKRVFDTEDGKIIFNDLARMCGVFDLSFCSGDTHGTAFNEGMRNVILHIVEKLQLTPDDVSRLREENIMYSQEEYYE